MPNWNEEIVQQMDREAEAYGFLMLNNIYFRGAAVRLTTFRNSSEWLIVFQQIAVMEKRDFVDAVSAYGNQLGRPGTQKVVRLLELPPTDDGHEVVLNKWDFALEIKGKVLHYAPTAQDYARAGVDVNDEVPDNVKILRFLATQAPEDLFQSDHDLLRICGRHGAGLSDFIRLDSWHHPDVAADELPSQNDCLLSLARALSADDPRLYQCPAPSFNTHWSNWEDMYGDL